LEEAQIKAPPAGQLYSPKHMEWSALEVGGSIVIFGDGLNGLDNFGVDIFCFDGMMVYVRTLCKINGKAGRVHYFAALGPLDLLSPE
jgi:hypothetical protein